MAGTLDDAIDAVAQAEGFSGAIRVDVDDEVLFCRAYGLADRAHAVPNGVETRFALASGTKGLTALAVVSLIVVGSGDGGIYSTVDDVHRLWHAFTTGAVVPPEWVDEMVRPRSEARDGPMRYGLGWWLTPAGRGVLLEGCDAGVSFRSVHDPEHRSTWTVDSNTSEGAWPLALAVTEQLTS